MRAKHLFPAPHGGPVVFLAALLLLSGAACLLTQPALAGGGQHGKHHKAKIVKNHGYKIKSGKNRTYRVKPHKAKPFRTRAPRAITPVSRPHRTTPSVKGVGATMERRQVIRVRSSHPSRPHAMAPRAQSRPATSMKRRVAPKRIGTRQELTAHLRPEPRVPRAELARFRTQHARTVSRQAPQRLRHEPAARPSPPAIQRTSRPVRAVVRPAPMSRRQPSRTGGRNRQLSLQSPNQDRPVSTRASSSAATRAAVATPRPPHARAPKQRIREARQVHPERHPFSSFYTRSHTRRLTMWERRTGRHLPARQLRHAVHAPQRLGDHQAAFDRHHHARKHHRVRHGQHAHARHHRHHRHHHRLAHMHHHHHHHHHHAVLAYSYFPIFHPLYGWYDPWPHAIFAYYGYWPGWIYDVPPWLRWRFWIAHYRLYGSYPHAYCPHSVAVLAYLGYAGAGDYDNDYDDDGNAYAYVDYDDEDDGYAEDSEWYDEDGDDLSDDCPDDD